MAEITLVIGGDASWTEGRGEVRSVVIDRENRAVTHLVVEPKGRAGLARLVPLDLVDATTGEIRLRCTGAEFQNLGPAEETLAEFVPGYDVPVQLLPEGWRDAGGPTMDGATPGPLRTPEKETINIVPQGGWRSAAATTCTPPTATSGKSGHSASTLAATR